MDNSIVPTPLRYLGHLRLRLIKPLELCLQTRRQGAEVDTTSPEERWTLRWDFKREGRKCDKQHNRHVTTPERSEHINNTFFKKKKKKRWGVARLEKEEAGCGFKECKYIDVLTKTCG